MARFSFGWLGAFARVSLVAATAFLAACGSGAVSAPPGPVNSGPITITPNAATLYSDTPSTFVITGGNGDYLIVSSDQSALPVAGELTSNVLTVVPNPVAADTPVTLTVRDTSTSTPVTATLTVKPRTVSNVVTILPSTTDCVTAICSGGDAEVSVKIAQNGLPLANHTVRFDVVSGNFGIITSPAGLPETTSLTGTTTTDASGTARMRIRVAPDAPSQTGLLQITDVSSGSSQRVSFLIAQNTGSSAGFFATPQTITFQGPNTQQCANGSVADVYVFGGVPPYTVANTSPSAFSVSPTVVSLSGGRFSVVAQGTCATAPITVRDSAGRTATITATNVLGTQSAPALSVVPNDVTLSSCTSTATATIVGGTGNYTVSPGSNAVTYSLAGSSLTLSRTPTSGGSGTVLVGISDGRSTATVTVHLAAATGC